MADKKKGSFNLKGVKSRVILILAVLAVITIGFLLQSLSKINQFEASKDVLLKEEFPHNVGLATLSSRVNEATHLLNLWANSQDSKYRDLLKVIWENDINPNVALLDKGYEEADTDLRKIIVSTRNNLSALSVLQGGFIENSENIDYDQFKAVLNNEIYPELENFNRNSQLLMLKTKDSIDLQIVEIDSAISNQKALYYVAIFLTVVLLLLMGWLITKYYLEHLERIKAPLKVINAGDIPENLNGITDESKEILDEIQNLSSQLANIKDIAVKVGEGEFETEIAVFENEGEVGSALEGMRKSLRRVAVEDEQRNWLNAGYAQFGDILRENNNDIGILCEQVIISLVKYLEANQGALFLMEGEGEQAVMEMKACYAYERKKKIESKIIKGEGLVGQSWQENDTIYVTDIPDSYISIRSGLGDANPKSIIVVPLRTNEEIVGVVEVASFKDIEEYQQEFVEKVSENIAAAVSNTVRNEQTSKLLGESQQMTEEMRAQEEEMRQNMEELEATQEEMARAQREIGKKESNLNALINNTEDTIFAIDKEYRITVVNDTLKNKYKGFGINLDEGSFIYDALNEEQWATWKERYDRALAGERYTKVEESSGSDGKKYVETFHNPIQDAEGQIIGVSVISRDVTNLMKTQEEVKQKQNTLNALINSSDDTYFALDKDYRITVVNDTLKDRFAATGTTLNVGDYIFDKLPEESHKVWKERYDRSLAGEAFTEDQERQVNEITLYIRGYYNPITDEDGNIIGASVRSSDITEMKKIMDELEEAQKELAKLKK